LVNFNNFDNFFARENFKAAKKSADETFLFLARIDRTA
jgi:hypothetical protein